MRLQTYLAFGLVVGFVLVFSGCDSAGPAPADMAPIATNDSFTLSAGEKIESADILQNDVDPDKVDPDGDNDEELEELTVNSIEDPLEKGLSSVDDFPYSLPSDFAGEDQFTYTIKDEGNGKTSNVATVTITVE